MSLLKNHQNSFDMTNVCSNSVLHCAFIDDQLEAKVAQGHVKDSKSHNYINS